MTVGHSKASRKVSKHILLFDIKLNLMLATYFEYKVWTRTKWYSCVDIGHWSADCRKPCTPQPAGKTNPTSITYGLITANLAERLRVDLDTANSDDNYANMVTFVMHSCAFYNSSSVTWYVDSGASNRMTNRWISSPVSILPGSCCG